MRSPSEFPGRLCVGANLEQEAERSRGSGLLVRGGIGVSFLNNSVGRSLLLDFFVFVRSSRTGSFEFLYNFLLASTAP